MSRITMEENKEHSQRKYYKKNSQEYNFTMSRIPIVLTRSL